LRECGLNWVVVVGEMLNEHNELIEKILEDESTTTMSKAQALNLSNMGSNILNKSVLIYVCKNGGSIRKLHLNDDYE
jgi:hypothetical protein